MAFVLLGWPGGSLESALKLVAALLVAYVIVLWISAIVWVYRDVRSRTTDAISQSVALILVSLFNLPGLMVYLVVRPQETLADTYERSLEAEAILHELQTDAAACQTCRRPIEPDFVVCPHCKTVLREPCRSCGRAIRTNWQACPYCATDRVAAPIGRSTAVPLADMPTATPPIQPPPRQAARPAQAEASVPRQRPPVAR